MTLSSLSSLAALPFAMAPAQGAGGQGAAGSSIGMFVYLGLLILLFYFMLIRPQRRREKERRALLDAVKTGDRILFAGGFIGTVANVKDKTLVVKIADNVKVEIARAAVAQILTKDADPNAAADKPA
ncbi:MAG: preprotein translocase subunit YajC [Kiritimatiellae bacterium]|nr:preprotein translocase subunit YajC [Kiritimatiellia bacterium]MBQ9344577.1 preprotein translocase subunit YajC [Kiritimatiellia bacterium]